MGAMLVALGAIFLAELGDKSQLIAIAFAMRYRTGTVLAGVAAAGAVVQGLWVAVGAALQVSLSSRNLALAAGGAFIGFAVWALVDTDGENLPARASGRDRSAVAVVAIAFLIAEIGDKTMLATVGIAARQSPPWTWAGATLGMVAANGLVVAPARRLGERLPRRGIRMGSALVFAAAGVVLLVEALTG